MTEDLDAPTLPPQVKNTVQAIAELHAQHHLQKSGIERFIDYLTGHLGSPAFLGLLVVFVSAWSAANYFLPKLGYAAWDPPPFSWLEVLLTVTSVMMATLILSSQKRANRLAGRRDQLNLEVSILSEQKATKIISLLEELRRDLPLIRDREDAEAKQMAEPIEPQAVLEAFEAHVGADNPSEKGSD